MKNFPKPQHYYVIVIIMLVTVAFNIWNLTNWSPTTSISQPQNLSTSSTLSISATLIWPHQDHKAHLFIISLKCVYYQHYQTVVNFTNIIKLMTIDSTNFTFTTQTFYPYINLIHHRNNINLTNITMTRVTVLL